VVKTQFRITQYQAQVSAYLSPSPSNRYADWINRMTHHIGLKLFLLVILALVGGIFLPNSIWSRIEPVASATGTTFTVTNTNDSGAGSFRQAILDANTNPGVDQISFSIGTGHQTIAPTSRLPDISDPVVIDATTQPGFAGSPLIEVSGDYGSSVSNHGVLYITAGNSTVRGLIISHFHDGGISIFNGGGNYIEGNYIGTDASGNLPTGSKGNGITVNSSSNNIIGGTAPNSRNVISGIQAHGISIFGLNSTGNTIQGNFIGTNAAGSVGIGNFLAGIFLGASNNTVGGTVPSARNVITDNEYGGIVLQVSGTSGNIIQGNYIGTDATGSIAIGDVYNNGIAIFNSSNNNIIGGTNPGARNVVSGNGNGISIASSTDAPSGNVVQGNYVGVAADGVTPLGNFVEGIRLAGALNTTVGGTNIGAGNIIAFNGPTAEVGAGTGVEVLSGSGNSIRGNSIFSNGRLGIDLGNDGVTPNDAVDVDGGPNNRQNFPVITSVVSEPNQTTITGTLNSTPGTTFAINFYSNASCDPSGNGEGARPFGLISIPVTTNANGNASFGVAISTPLPAGHVITATATDPSGNTSEFSSCDPSKAMGSAQFSSTSFKAVEDAVFATITVSRVGGQSGTLSVDYATTDGTAIAGQDYTAVAGTLVFADGETTKTFNVPVSTDAVSENDESLTLRLINPTAPDTIASRATATLVIQDDFNPPALFVSDVSMTEGNSGTVNAVFTVSLKAQTARTVTANYSTQPVDATSGVDFQPVTGTLTFNPHETSQTISVPIIGDTLDEANEQFRLRLTNPFNAVVEHNGNGTILDDDPQPTISISDISVAEGNSGTTSAVFTLSLSASAGRQIFVGYTTTNGTATSDSDYVSTSGVITFNPGETQKSITVQVNGDTVDESNETFLVNLNSPVNVTLARAQATGTILNDDVLALQLTSNSYLVNEADTSGQATITVNRTGNPSGPVSVDYATSDTSALVPCQTNTNGSASDRCDYATTVGTLRFAAGETSKNISIPLINDAYVEPDELFTITLSNAKGAALGTSTATVTIQSDDTQAANANPIEVQDFFIKQQYVDFLGRVAEPSGFNFWMNRMNNCPQGQICDRIDTSQRFFQSDEFQERGFYVYRLYDAVLGRLPKYAEFVPDVARLNGPQTVSEQRLGKDAYLLDFINKQEFRNLYGAYVSQDGLTAVDAAGFVNALCQKAGITPAAKQTLIDNLQNKVKDPAHTLEDFILQPEISGIGTLYYDRGFITMQYFGYLRRDPEQAGFDFWVGQLIGANAPHRQDYRFMVGGFLQSDEYRFRFALISTAP
jgi:hypothetical protein